MTLAKYEAHFEAEIMPGKLAASTQARFKQDMRRILPILGHVQLRELDKAMVRKCYDALRQSKNLRTGEPISEKTVAGIHANLCGLLSSAIDEGYLQSNPAWRCYKWSGMRKDHVMANETQIEELIEAFEKEPIQYEVFFKLVLATGCRRGEACGLQWQDILWEERALRIRRNVVEVHGGGAETLVKDPKTRAGNRVVFLSQAMLELLKEFRTVCEGRCAQDHGRALCREDYIFLRHDMPAPMCPGTFTYRFNLILKKNGLPKELTVHSLRHTNASVQIAAGIDVATVASNLGHSQPSTTLDIYSYAFDKRKREAQEKLSEVMGI